MDSNRLVLGFILLLLGLGFLFDSLGISRILGTSFGEILGNFWPLIILGLGVLALARKKTQSGLILILLGALMQFSQLFRVNFWGLVWPLAFIGLGLIVLTKKPTFGGITSGTETVDKINDRVLFWGSEKKVNSQNFQGGRIECTFGGYELNLRDAKISKEGAQIKISCAFRGVEIHLPKDCRVEIKGTPFLGGWENHFTPSEKENLPLLTIEGSVAFGGVEINN